MKSRRVSITDHSFTLSSSEDAFHFCVWGAFVYFILLWPFFVGLLMRRLLV